MFGRSASSSAQGNSAQVQNGPDPIIQAQNAPAASASAPSAPKTLSGKRRTEMLLLIVATIILAFALIAVEMANNKTLTIEVVYVLGGYIATFTAAHLMLRWKAPYADEVMLPVAAVLNAIGLVMIYRIDIPTERSLANSQILWTVLGVLLLMAVIFFLQNYKSLQGYSYLLGIGGLILTALPMVWPTELNANARVWIQVGPFSIQPGEFAKILLLLFFASLLENKRALFSVAGTRVLGVQFPRLRDLGPILIVWAVALLLMAGENDFGPALLLFGTVLGMLYIATSRSSWLIIGFGLAAVGAVSIYQISAKIQTRVDNFIDPIGNIDNGGYQLSQALFGMSWGGLTGTGLGKGYPETVPVVESDFILAAIGEELGLIGLAAVILLYAVFVIRGLRTGMMITDTYGKLVASGLALAIMVQVFVVVGGVSKLLPMTGLTTPFVAHGGSSLLANYVLLAIILRISNTARAPRLTEASAGTGTGVGTGVGAAAGPAAGQGASA